MTLVGLFLLAAAGHVPEEPPAALLPHAIAGVNDPLSHGTLGDALLSLNEAILLHNRQLQLGQLSPSELNQIWGPGDVGIVSIDASGTPTITVERDLDPVIDIDPFTGFPMTHGFLLRGDNGLPVIDFTTSTGQHGFRATSDQECNWWNLIVQGAPWGIELVQRTAIQGTFLSRVEFTGQTQGGVRVTMVSAGGALRLLLDACRFTNIPTGIVLDERAAGCTSRLLVIDTHMSGLATGIDVQLGSGGFGVYELDQLDFDVTGSGVRFARPNGADRRVTLVSVQAGIRGGTALDLAGSPTGPTILQVRMAKLRAATAAGKALAIGPLGSSFAGDLDDVETDGDVDLLTGAGAVLTVTNGRLRNGAIRAGSSSGSLRFVDTRFDACAVQTQGAVAVQLGECCVAGGSLAGIAAAPLVCNGCYVQAGVGAFVTQTASRPAAQLGSFHVGPATIAIGGPLVYQADLPPGLFGVFALGLSQDPGYLNLMPYPLHVYSDPAATATIPGLWRLQQTFTFAIPNALVLVGMDLTGHMAVLPDPGVQAPWINLPPGRRFVLQ
jgi:hypothetical protein